MMHFKSSIRINAMATLSRRDFMAYTASLAAAALSCRAVPEKPLIDDPEDVSFYFPREGMTVPLSDVVELPALRYRGRQRIRSVSYVFDDRESSPAADLKDGIIILEYPLDALDKGGHTLRVDIETDEAVYRKSVRFVVTGLPGHP